MSARSRKTGALMDATIESRHRQDVLDAVIVGVNCLSEFEQIELSAASSAGVESDIDINQPIDRVYVDPSRWPLFVH